MKTSPPYNESTCRISVEEQKRMMVDTYNKLAIFFCDLMEHLEAHPEMKRERVMSPFILEENPFTPATRTGHELADAAFSATQTAAYMLGVGRFEKAAEMMQEVERWVRFIASKAPEVEPDPTYISISSVLYHANLHGEGMTA